MCGIAGILQITSRIERSEMLQRVAAMAETLNHRGPDAGAHWADPDGTIALAHRRLAIVELTEHGAQPMVGPGGRLTLTFNGEIYNHAEIRRELQAEGFTFRGRSDTEVLVTALEAWGLDTTLRKSVGMFAFAAWDHQNKQLWLARDRLGEKPLYYGWVHGAWVFASELKALRELPAFEGHIDQESLALYLRYGYVPGPRSIYEGVYKLPPGAFLTLPFGRQPDDFSPFPERVANIRPCYYWLEGKTARELPVEQILRSDKEVRDELDKALRVAVAGQMEADVPLGAFLSGGVDSSAVVAVMQALSSRPINTYTIGFTDPEYNEAAHAKAVADHLGTRHTELYVTPKMALEMVPRIPVVYDEPFADASQIPMMMLAQMARQHVTVCLAGDGGDELFCGYNRYTYAQKLWRWQDHRRLRGLVASLIETLPTAILARLYRVVGRWEQGPIPLGSQNIRARLAKLAMAMREDSLVGLYRSLVSYWQQPDTILLQAVGEPFEYLSPSAAPCSQGVLDQAMQWDMLTYLPDDNLVKGDRASMASSLELRLPLLDHRVVELACSIPANQKLRDGYTKWPLRQVLYQYVPSTLIDRPKMGFSVPIASWLRNELREWAEALLEPAALEASGHFHVTAVQKLWREHMRGSADHGQRLWTLLMFQEWLVNQKGGSKVGATSELVIT